MQAEGIVRVYPAPQPGLHSILRNLGLSRQELQQWMQVYFADNDLWAEVLSLVVGLFGKVESGNEELTRAATEKLCMRLTELKEVFSASPLQLKTFVDAVERSAEIGALRERSAFADQVLERLLKLEERSVAVPQEVSSPARQYPFDFSRLAVTHRDMVSWIASESEDQTELELLIEEIEEMVPGTEDARKGQRVLPELQSRLRKKVTEIERVKRLAGELKKYLDALKVLETPLRAEVFEWKTPDTSSAVSEEVAVPALKQESVLHPKSDVKAVSLEVDTPQVSKDQEKLLALLEQDYGLLRGDVAVISLYEMAGRSKHRSLTTLIMCAISAGVFNRFGWGNMRDVFAHSSKYEGGGEVSRSRFLDYRGTLGKSTMFIRTSEPIPWSLGEIFSDAEMLSFKEEISKPR